MKSVITAEIRARAQRSCRRFRPCPGRPPDFLARYRRSWVAPDIQGVGGPTRSAKNAAQAAPGADYGRNWRIWLLAEMRIFRAFRRLAPPGGLYATQEWAALPGYTMVQCLADHGLEILSLSTSTTHLRLTNVVR